MYYHRAQIPGATYFLNVNLANRKLSLLVDNTELPKEAIRHVKMTRPYEIVAMVLRPAATRWACPPPMDAYRCFPEYTQPSPSTA